MSAKLITAVFVMGTAILLLSAWCLPASYVAWMGVHVLGNSGASIIAKGGKTALWLAALMPRIFMLLPVYFLGLVASILTQRWLDRLYKEWRWQAEGYPESVRKKRKLPGTYDYEDGCGVSICMYGMEMDPPQYQFPLQFVRAKELEIINITNFERDLVGVLRAYADCPAAMNDKHHGGESLLNHTLSMWAHALRKHGAGSLESMLTLAHDCGKLLAYQRNDNGIWVRVHYSHQIKGLHVARNMPGLRELPLAKAEEFMLVFTAMMTKVEPMTMSSAQKQSIRYVRSLDISSIHSEQDAARDASGSVDEKMPELTQLQQALFKQQEFNKAMAEAWPKILEALNINRSLAASEPLAGVTDNINMRVLIQISAINKLAIKHLPEPLVSHYRMMEGVIEEGHTAAFAIYSFLNKLEMLVIFDNFNDKCYLLKQAQSGKSRLRNLVCIRQDVLPPEVVKRWGRWSTEIDLII